MLPHMYHLHISSAKRLNPSWSPLLFFAKLRTEEHRLKQAKALLMRRACTCNPSWSRSFLWVYPDYLLCLLLPDTRAGEHNMTPKAPFVQSTALPYLR
jgi:hypothetical protein